MASTLVSPVGAPWRTTAPTSISGRAVGSSRAAPIAAARRQGSGSSLLRPQPHTPTLSRGLLLCRATDGQEPPQQQQEAPPAAGSQQAPPSVSQRPAAEDPNVAKGQRTAIVTGAISIIFGVIYLALVSFLDMRGGEMLPPPPEAFGP